jgi:large subunit ribosomal protein L22
MEAIAQTKYLKGSPRKARLVIDLIRGRNVAQALAILKFTDKRAAEPIEKCVRSAIANATFLAERQNIAIDPDDLWVKSCFVNMGPTKNRRRVRPAPQGRAFREQRHYCHITIMLTSDKPEDKVATTEKPAEGATPEKKTAAKSRAKSAAPKKEKTAKAKTEMKKSSADEEKSSKS